MGDMMALGRYTVWLACLVVSGLTSLAEWFLITILDTRPWDGWQGPERDQSFGIILSCDASTTTGPMQFYLLLGGDLLLGRCGLQHWLPSCRSRKWAGRHSYCISASMQYSCTVTAILVSHQIWLVAEWVICSNEVQETISQWAQNKEMSYKENC